MRKLNQNKKGFTLIELLIVVAIIGILAAIAIPRFAAFSSKDAEWRKTGICMYEGEKYRVESVDPERGVAWIRPYNYPNAPTVSVQAYKLSDPK